MIPSAAAAKSTPIHAVRPIEGGIIGLIIGNDEMAGYKHR